MKKKTFNAIVFKAHDNKGFVFLKYDKKDNNREAFRIDLDPDFMKEEQIENQFPFHKIVLSTIKQETDSEISIIPKYCIELKLNDKVLNFMEIAENQEFLEYFMHKIHKKL